MLKKLLVVLLLFSSSLFALAQTEEDLYNSAKAYMQGGEMDNAIQTYKKLLEKNATHFEALKDYAYISLVLKDYAKALELSKTLVSHKKADEMCFEIAGISLKSVAMFDEATKLYKTALKKFPTSGSLYAEQADLFKLQNKYTDAIAAYEKGIEVDPNYSNNYYNACVYYAKNNNHFWAAVYGEVFVNLESYTLRTAEVKLLVLQSYKKLMATVENSSTDNSFEKAFTESLVTKNTEATVSKIIQYRTKFLLNWFYAKHNETYPFRLFEQQRYLLREGMFEAYNQWLFGVAQNPDMYNTWSEKNAKQVTEFKDFQQARVFKLLPNQYYRY